MAVYKVSTEVELPVSLNESEEIRNILQNVRMILTTRKGTVPMYRDFGLNWTQFFDRPVPVAETIMVSVVREAVERWESRVVVRKVTCHPDAVQPGGMAVEVEVEVNTDGGPKSAV